MSLSVSPIGLSKRQLRWHEPNMFTPSFAKELVENRFLTLVQVYTNHRILNLGVWETQDTTEFSSLNWLNLWTNLVHKQYLLSCSRCLFEEAESQNFHIVVCYDNINTIIMTFITSWHSYWNLTYVKRLYLKVHKQFWERATIIRTCKKWDIKIS